MKELLDAVTDWRALTLALGAYGFAPGFLLRLLVLLYPRKDPRRRELVAELYAVPRWNRPFWVFEQLETALFEGIALRAAATATFLRQLRSRTRTDSFKLPHGPTMTVPREAAMLAILRAAEPQQAVPVVTIQGMAGVGKSALVVQAAHRLIPQFPDGQFFVKLHGNGYADGMSEVMDVLGGLLAELGINGRRTPRTLRGREELWRKLLTNKRILLVLDDSSDGSHVASLLPPQGRSMALVTRPAGSTGRGPNVITLDALDRASAVELFLAHAGRVIDLDTDLTAVTTIVERCEDLPLAISIAARCLASHPLWSVSELADMLIDPSQAAIRHPVRNAFNLKYRELTPRQQILLGRLSLYPGHVIDAETVAPFTGLTVDVTQQELQSLRAHGLLAEPDPGRYALHDLVHAYARELIAIEGNSATGQSN